MAGVLSSAVRAKRLAVFMEAAAANPFVYGKFDCALMPADWCREESGIDPAATIRDTYCDEESWQVVADAAGGLVPLWRRLGTRAGLKIIRQPAIGDIGLVGIGDGQVYGAILGPRGRWMVKLDRGIVGGGFDCISAWGVPCHSR